ncbi:hypothetical protein DdX_20819 [Ditylenchus destructor]|uniref:Uncharacterized protein n=1 Tax=Ditylenchus destructor TaxID=166010 RepID=A0AAD4QVT6_9BILA|nr:hypothetical protein DdX_20819 [Ditylenchus destructor]
MRYKFAYRPLKTTFDNEFNPIHYGGKLLHQYATDCWTRIEGDLLEFQKIKNEKMKKGTAFDVRNSINSGGVALGRPLEDGGEDRTRGEGRALRARPQDWLATCGGSQTQTQSEFGSV